MDRLYIANKTGNELVVTMTVLLGKCRTGCEEGACLGRRLMSSPLLLMNEFNKDLFSKEFLISRIPCGFVCIGN